MKARLFISTMIILLIISLPFVFAAEISRTYDANGNLIRNSDEDYYREYNSLNQLSEIRNQTNDNIIQEYTYHPTEERVLVKKKYDNTETLTETVVYFDKTNVRVVNSSGTYDTTYVYHEGSLVSEELSGVKTYHHSDHLGSSTVVTDSSGDVIENTSYSPYGEVLTGGSSRYDYEGKESDEYSGIDFEFRTYDASIGMFNKPDTLIQNVYDPQSLNRYMFERGNPYKYTDPTGHFVCGGFCLGLIIIGTAIISGYKLGNDIQRLDNALEASGQSANAVDYAVIGTSVAFSVGGFKNIQGFVEGQVVDIGTSTYFDWRISQLEGEDEENEDCIGCIKKDLGGGKYLLYNPESQETPTVQFYGSTGSGGGDVNFWINYASLNNNDDESDSSTGGGSSGGGGGGSGGGDDEGTNCVTQTYGNIQVTVCS